jgi:hypothetical protein
MTVKAPTTSGSTSVGSTPAHQVFWLAVSLVVHHRLAERVNDHPGHP